MVEGGEHEAFEIASCVRGHHVYQEQWTAAVREILECKRERGNATDMYAVSVTKQGTIVGHLPRKISRVCALFIRRGGKICCQITARRRHSSDLPQGGLEIPCRLLFYGKDEEIKKLRLITNKLNLL